jgi:FkbM family methyltransferase
MILRAAARILPGLRSFPLEMRTVGTALVDFRETSAYSLLNYSLGERGSDWALLSAIAHVLKPHHKLWDVGANVGYITQHFAQPRFQVGEIHAFEPNPIVRKTLEALFAKHSRVRVHPVALGEHDAQKEIRVCPHASAEGSLVRDLPGSRPLSIQVRRADAYRIEKGLKVPDIVKIDVEGFEPQVLAGMQKIIAERRPIIFFEHIWITEETIRKCVPIGYEISFLLDDGVLTRDFALRTRGANAILTPLEKVALLPTRVTREGAY